MLTSAVISFNPMRRLGSTLFRKRIDDLYQIHYHDFIIKQPIDLSKKSNKGSYENCPPFRHPLVQKHPVTRRHSFFYLLRLWITSWVWKVMKAESYETRVYTMRRRKGLFINIHGRMMMSCCAIIIGQCMQSSHLIIHQCER